MTHPTIPPTAITRSWTISAGVPSPKDADANIDSGLVVAVGLGQFCRLLLSTLLLIYDENQDKISRH
jgi:hypothetical protein